MSNQLSNGFCGKLTALAMLAASLSLSALPGTLAQSMGDSRGDSSSSSSATNSNATSAATTSASTSAPLPGDSSSSTTSSASAAAPASGDSTSTTTTTTTTAAPTSDIPPGVLWTDPKYAVKEVTVPTRVAVPNLKRPTTGTTSTTTKTTTTTAAESVNLGYDDKAAQSFADSVGAPALVWTRQDPATKGQKAAALTAAKEMAAYNRTLVERFVANMTVPTSATLVENTKNEYLYLLSFTIDDKGKIGHINPVTSYGKLSALTLADDNENRMMYSSMTQALTKCSPLKVPKLGFAPWYMLLKYEPNTGKVFVTNVNGI